MPGRWRGRASMPGSWGLAAIGKKKRACCSPPVTGGLEFFSWEDDLGAGLAGWRLLCRAGGAAGGARGVPSLNMSTRHVEAIRLRYRAGGGGFNARQVARQETLALSLEGVSQMVYILPERLLTLVRPAFDLVLRRIRSLKRCVQACGCKIESPRYALQFGSRLHFKRCQPLPKETPFPFFSGTLFLGPPVFFFFVFS